MPTLNVANRTLFHDDNLAFLRGPCTGSNPRLVLGNLRSEIQRQGRMTRSEH